MQGRLQVGIESAVAAVERGTYIVVVLFGYSLVKGGFSCHERGASLRGLRKDERLSPYQVVSSAHPAMRMYVNGACAGNSPQSDSFPKTRRPMPTVKYGTTVQNVDNDLDALRTRIFPVVAQRLLKECAEMPTCQCGVSEPSFIRGLHAFTMIAGPRDDEDGIPEEE